MFQVNSNNNILLNQGDATGNFPLVILTGDTLSTTEYSFVQYTKTITCPSNLTVEFEVETWKTKITASGTYTFTYSTTDTSWMYDSKTVTMTDYGLTVTGVPVNNDQIVVAYTKGDGCEIYFYLIQPNLSYHDAFLYKKFTSDSNLYTATGTENYGRIKLSLNPTDLLTDNTHTFNQVPGGTYYYLIRAKLLNEDNELQETTLMNKHEFYYIDDNYSNRLWGVTSNTNNSVTAYTDYNTTVVG